MHRKTMSAATACISKEYVQQTGILWNISKLIFLFETLLIDHEDDQRNGSLKTASDTAEENSIHHVCEN